MCGREGFPPPSDERAQTSERLREQGRTTKVVRLGDRDLGAIGLMDTPRAAAKDAIARLRAIGIRPMIMISGEKQRVSTAIDAADGTEEDWGDLLHTTQAETHNKPHAPPQSATDGGELT